MFSKWPVAVSTDIADMISRKEFKKLSTKYVSPVLALMAGQQMLDQIADDDNPYRRALMGRNMVNAAPLWSFSVVQPPALSTVSGLQRIVKNAATDWDDPDRMSKLMGSVQKTAAPWVPVFGHIKTQMDRYRGTEFD